jgi:methylamine dehydrogenase accessory protein MauD
MESALAASNIALWVVVIAQAVFILALFHYVGVLLERFPSDGPVVGQRAPRVEIEDTNGGKHVIGDRAARNRVLIVTSPSCPWCEKLAPDIAPFAGSLGSDYEVLVISAADLDRTEAQAYLRRLDNGSSLKMAVAPHLLEPYGIRGTPYAILLDKDGVVRNKGVPNTGTDLETLVSATQQSGREVTMRNGR